MDALAFPPLLTRLLKIECDYDDGNGIDFEPHSEFMAPAEAQRWFHAWTGNAVADASPYRIFGQDGTGGYVAFWLVRTGADVLQQPIVFFGSEGELGVVARDFLDYLWLLAGRYGPYEATAYPIEQRTPDAEFAAFAIAHAPDRRKSVAEVVAAAQEEFPSFVADVQKLCGY
ncbi:MAG: hypothetical protein U5M53_05500 [Rhodoferax sp.]|nr:hypothetical protein [Rhodoferax sp.]